MLFNPVPETPTPNETPAQTIARLEVDVQRLGVHNLALQFRLGELRRTVRHFVEGCGLNPIVSRTGQRVIGYKDRLDEVMTVWSKPLPVLLSREEMAKAMIEYKDKDDQTPAPAPAPAAP